MKKVLKKMVAAAMAVTMMATAAFALSSCGKTKNESFKLGVSGPLTGDAASYGQSVQNGAKLAIKHVNAKGGLQLSLSMLDDMGTPEQAAANYDLLYDEGMQLSLGGVTSGAGEAFAKKANVDSILCMTPSGSADRVIDNMDYSFRLCFGDPDQGALAADEIKAKGYAKVGAMYDTSDTYSSGIYDAFKARMEELGIAYVEQSFDKENKTDFTTQAGALADCDVIFMPFYYNEAQLFMKAAVSKGCDGVFFGCDGFDGIASYISDITNKVMYITPFDVNSEEQAVKDFVAAYKAEYNGAEPDQFAADAYDVVMVFAKALEQAGVTDYDLSAKEVSDAVKAVILSADFSYTGLTGNGMKWTADGKCAKAPKIVEFN